MCLGRFLLLRTKINYTMTLLHKLLSWLSPSCDHTDLDASTGFCWDCMNFKQEDDDKQY